MNWRPGWNRVASLKLRHFEVLLAVERHRSLSRAADALEISQPAVSQWIADLESALAVTLYERSRPLRPTVYAGAVIRHAQRVMNDARRAYEEIESLRRGSVGRVRIGVMPAVVATIMPDVVRALASSAPSLSLLIVEDIWAGLWQRFERSELDLLVGRPDTNLRAQGFAVETLSDDPHVVTCGLAHPLAKMSSPTWADASAYDFIVPPAGTPLHDAIHATFAAARLSSPRVALESAAHALNHELLQGSSLLAVAPRAAAELAESRGLVCALPLALLVDVGPLGMVWRETEADDALQRVVDAFREVVRDSPAT